MSAHEYKRKAAEERKLRVPLRYPLAGTGHRPGRHVGRVGNAVFALGTVVLIAVAARKTAAQAVEARP